MCLSWRWFLANPIQRVYIVRVPFLSVVANPKQIFWRGKEAIALQLSLKPVEPMATYCRWPPSSERLKLLEINGDKRGYS